MGLDLQNAKFLSLCKRLGADFSSTLTFGRQEVVVSDRSKIQLAGRTDSSIFKDRYADSYLKSLNARTIDVCDASDYEGANIILDLNSPPPKSMTESYSCVIDLGTLEHVFHYSKALETAMSCVAKDGHLIIATPANNFMGHGFYQLSPELFLRALSPANGFKIATMILADQYEESPWYEIDLDHRPSELAKRFTPPTNWAATYLMILARREVIKPIFAMPPQQESYESMWVDSGKDVNFPDSVIKTDSLISQIASLLKKGPFITFYRKCRAVLKPSRLPKYYRIIPSTVWRKY